MIMQVPYIFFFSSISSYKSKLHEKCSHGIQVVILIMFFFRFSLAACAVWPFVGCLGLRTNYGGEKAKAHERNATYVCARGFEKYLFFFGFLFILILLISTRFERVKIVEHTRVAFALARGGDGDRHGEGETGFLW